MASETIILGAGMSGLGAALSSQLPVYDAAARPGGVCHSYYRGVDGAARDPLLDNVSDCFRFEPAGGHWLFGVSEASLDRLNQLCTFRKYVRRAAAFFPRDGRYVPYPLQDNLRYLDAKLRDQILAEIGSVKPGAVPDALSFEEWLLECFGATLCQLFFFPFNDRYTSGYFRHIEPQDLYKSAIDRERVLHGAFRPAPDAGYNTVFYYPEGGLDRLIRALSSGCRLHLAHEATTVDTSRRIVQFANGACVSYDGIISTIPLNRMAQICNITCSTPPDPATAVLVVNIGARKGPRCPPYHWVYVPSSTSGIHRVGFYSNVDRSFLPIRWHDGDDFVSIYAERSYPGGAAPSAEAIAGAVNAIVGELKEWGFIADVLVVEPTFTDPAYTWTWQRSAWAKEAMQLLAERGIRQIGRYGAWKFQGMMASFEEGIAAGEACGA